jgi:hypothetical protein
MKKRTDITFGEKKSTEIHRIIVNETNFLSSKYVYVHKDQRLKCSNNNCVA